MTLDPRWLTGHIPSPTIDPNEPEYRDHVELLGAPVLPSEDVDLRTLLPPIRQQKAQDCVAHSVSGLVRALAAAVGTPLPWGDEDPSVLHLYSNAILRASPKKPLVDLGSNLSVMLDGAREDGMVPESAWPEIPENVNVVPPDDVWRSAEGVYLPSRYRVSDGRSSSAEIRAGLRRKRCFTICMLVDERFANVGAGVYDAPGGRVIGSHCMLVCGYSSAARAFVVRNSWGEDFGDLGYALVHEDVVDRLSYEKYAADAEVRTR